MTNLVYTDKSNRKKDLPIIKCQCGTKILLVPDVKQMSEAIEAHVQEHKERIKNRIGAEKEAELIREDLIMQVLKIASETGQKP